MLRPQLTVIVPAYNESGTIAAVLDAVAAAAYRKQIVVVDDGSDDGTAEAIEAWLEKAGGDEADPEVRFARHPINRGKGAAIRTGLSLARGEVIIIQDADVEYDPGDYPAVVEPILAGRTDVVYGSRYLHRPVGRSLPWTRHRFAVVLLNTMVFVLYGRRLTDEATCYKAFRAEVLWHMDLCCERFEFCPEVTAKAYRMGLEILEVAVRYAPRTVAEGKKIRLRDAAEAVETLLRWRFATFRPRSRSTPRSRFRDALEAEGARKPVQPTSQSTDTGETQP